ncbi:MAG: hypothetical protein ABR987_17670 [Terracidiphilus sp.]|jgi:hypothetical protein
MNRYILIRRLRGPAFLLLVGVNALLAQTGVLGWGSSWPFYLILAGVIALAERAALATAGPVVPPQYPGAPQPGASYPFSPYSVTTPPQPPAAPSTAIVPAHSDDFGNGPNGGQS